MKNIKTILIIFVMASLSLSLSAQGLKDAMGKYCLIGAAINQWQSDGQDPLATAILQQHFNSAVAENCMKAENLQPAEGIFDFRISDKFVDYCEQNNLKVIGHCLVWHSQAPNWMFTDSFGRLVDRETLTRRIKDHVSTVVGRYKGRVYGWDVVNEAVEDDGSFRQSPLYKVLGEDFIEIAFRAAHEADPDAQLYINDYSMAKPGKRETICRIVRQLKKKGLRIDAVGMQSHNGMDYPDITEYEKSIDAFAALGVKVMMTELDLNVLPNPKQFGGADISQNYEYQQMMNPYANGLPKEKAKEVEQRYMEFFKIFYKHRDQISRINLWGIADHNSWLNGWPIKGRTNYPLLFDRQYQPKPLVQKIINLYK